MALNVNFKTPVAGTVAPAANAAPTQYFESSVRFNEVRAEVVGDGTSTSIVITHNLGMSPAELAADFPRVQFEPIAANAPSHFVSARATNTVTVGFNGTFLSGGTFGIISIQRPQSAGR